MTNAKFKTGFNILSPGPCRAVSATRDHSLPTAYLVAHPPLQGSLKCRLDTLLGQHTTPPPTGCMGSPFIITLKPGSQEA